MAKFRGKDVCFSPRLVFTPDESDATATAADIAQGKTAYVDNVKITGTMATPSGNQDIDTLDEYNVAAKATARVSAAERDKFIAENIKDGVTLLGITGDYTGVTPTGNVDIETLNEYNVSGKATARVSASQRALIIPENIAEGVTILGVTGTHQGGGGTSANYLTFSSPLNFTLATRTGSKKWNGTLYYSTDAATWNVWDGITTLSSADGKLYLRGSGNTKITGSISLAYGFNLTGSFISCKGNILTLLDADTVANGEEPQMSANAAFARLFANCTSLVEAPELPATTLKTNCYGGMFNGCTSLIEAPELPATTLAEGCYSNMFSLCTGLKYAQYELPATTLAGSCYGGMFNGCSNLVVPPRIRAATIPNVTDATRGSLWRMFQNCTNLEYIPLISAVSIGDYGLYEMFKGCTKIKVSDTQTSTYANAFSIPATGKGTAGTDALKDMFTSTGGTFTGTPSVNTTYYTSNEIIS